ncbi:spermatogenesis-associated protein 31D3-like isoform X2 [Equus caballus]|uniref:spermatogenesis-associated protein 31D3-like isoform X2 n=1 Tax=Equus caballus TaxID=9796 RepID=UPI0038B3DDBE
MAELQLELLGIPIPAFLCGVGLLLLSLCYLKRSPCFPKFRKERDINQCQGRAKRRRKGGTPSGWRACQSEAEEARKVLSLLQSPRGQHHDTICFRQLLCPDPSCEVCNSITVEVNRLLFLEELEDDTASVSSMASTASGTESSFTLSSAFSEVPPGDLTPSPPPHPSPPPPSVLSPNPMTPLADFHPHYRVTLCHQSLFLPWSPNSQQTVPHPNPLPFPLSHHMTPRQRVLFSNQRPLCL